MLMGHRLSLWLLIPLLSLMLIPLPASAAGHTIRLVVGQTTATVDGKDQTLDVAPFIVGGRTLVPLRFVAETMGLQVGWNPDTRTITLTGSGPVIRLQIDNPTAQAGDKTVTLDAPPIIQQSRTLVPVRFVVESLGFAVDWNGETRAITISQPPPTVQSGTVSVSIADYAFGPDNLTVKAGTTVVWTNSDRSNHTVTSDSGAFDSGRLGYGANFKWTFTAPGTYTYHCAIHSHMTGTITVQP